MEDQSNGESAMESGIAKYIERSKSDTLTARNLHIAIANYLDNLKGHTHYTDNEFTIADVKRVDGVTLTLKGLEREFTTIPDAPPSSPRPDHQPRARCREEQRAVGVAPALAMDREDSSRLLIFTKFSLLKSVPIPAMSDGGERKRQI
nr:hypothetical protein Iba_chr12bCG28090 [Ipomoea batatas]GMD69766.1 hypothetical protein Iba_chr12dCG22210 [Ipomoea batatas]